LIYAKSSTPLLAPTAKTAFDVIWLFAEKVPLKNQIRFCLFRRQTHVVTALSDVRFQGVKQTRRGQHAMSPF
jgi:hypothetical protein